jgi:hypothetical protein
VGFVALVVIVAAVAAFIRLFVSYRPHLRDHERHDNQQQDDTPV